MSSFTRRTFLAGSALAATALAACGNGVGNTNAQTIDARVETTVNYMLQRYPDAQDLVNKSAGMLVMPLVTEAGLGLGGAYGRGALRVGGMNVDYYSATSVSAGLQIGAQQYSHVLFFMTEEALAEFRRSGGWAGGADAEYALSDQADTIRADLISSRAPVIALVFAQAGLRAAATVEGIKYTRIIP
ncbi:twin-arginine translocation pathway signal sequence domain protein, putative [Oceanicola granulosus HTCC2516]|uniref:Twin-arginine translocation pathway signal sequence domain protein, putative n=1 Tax=Oceanicola granulosus (strain ATCC BAA-861 / DSM 15982 / KCTC 12143 / HTCC2516) TaxID=314256 RepID=Q2CHN0_OCEGH|nr:YSC84-related protein [Oceanicola granulosus]EAR52264.1 twin-arginine translocation pathway signal sequence domain protein, putative [Oceanicola granulosus HTCC2516]